MYYGGYVVDKQGTPLSLLEIRQCGASSKNCSFVYQEWKVEEDQSAEDYKESLTYLESTLEYLKTDSQYADWVEDYEKEWQEMEKEKL